MIDTPPPTVVLLAGGLGTRLRDAVSNVPKPMAPVGGRPFLEYLVEQWCVRGAKRIVLSIGHQAHVVRDHFRRWSGPCVIDFVEESEPLGTGGALREVLEVTSKDGPTLLIANGDTWFPIEPARFLADAARLGTRITIAAKAMAHSDRYGAIEVDGHDRVTGFGSPSSSACIINAGCYAIHQHWLAEVLEHLPRRCSFEREVLEPAARRGHVGISVSDAAFLDIGVPEDYFRAGTILASS